MDVLLRYNATSVVDMDAIQVTKDVFPRDELTGVPRQLWSPTLAGPPELTPSPTSAGTTFPLS